MKKYPKIVRHGRSGTHSMFEGNPHITIYEKMDGANSSFGLIDGKLRCFSRNRELDEENNLRGFYQWVHQNISSKDLIEGDIYYGEWLVPHTIKYPEEAYNNFYLFDIFKASEDKFTNSEEVRCQAIRLGIKTAPIFYEGKFKSLDHINSFAGKSLIGDVGEGVVIKNVNFTGRDGNQQYTKIVSDAFAEKAKTRKQRPLQNKNELDEFVDTYLTPARVEKMLHKLVDESVIEEEFGLEDMGTILKSSGGRIVNDILEEELDSLVKIVKRKIGRKYPIVVKKVINSHYEERATQ